MALATGIGGVFLKAQDRKELNSWYGTHFGITPMGMTVFAHFPNETGYFGDGPRRSMLNLRVDDLDALPAAFAAAGVRIDPKQENHSYGRFAWTWDPEGNRVELWPPVP